MGIETWVALLRGINVGGHRKLPMGELTSLLAGLGCRDVMTYIQSGNAVFRATEDLSTQIGDAIEAEKGFRPDIMLIKAQDFLRIAAANPFPEGEGEPKTLHVFFLSAATKDAASRLQPLTSAREKFHLTDEVMYLHCLDFLSGSKIGQKAEKLLGVSATARNWNTVMKLSAICEKNLIGD